MMQTQDNKDFIRKVKKEAKMEKLSIQQMTTLKGGGKSKPGPWT